MEIVLVVLMFCTYFYMCKYIWTARYVPRKSELNNISKKRYKSLKKSLSEIENQKMVNKKITIANKFMKVPLIGFNKTRRSEIHLLLSAVDKRDDNDRIILPEEIYFQQLGVAGMVAGLSFIVAIMLRNPVGLMGILVAPLAMGLVLGDLKEEQKKTSKAVSEEFFAFYKLYYVQFSRKDTVSTLRSVVASHMPRASMDFRRALGRFMSDLEGGEEYALSNLDRRYPENTKIHKFCAVARARSKGDEASYQSMRGFFTELSEAQDAFYEHELHRRQELLAKIILIYLVAVFAVIMIVLLVSMSKA